MKQSHPIAHAILSLFLSGLFCLAAAEPTKIIFRSGFEADVTATPANDPKDLVGKDRSVPPPNDWVKDLEAHPCIGRFLIQYSGGEPSQRIARIIPDPTNPKNRVLNFWLKHANEPLPNGGAKGRIQADIYDNKNLRELRQRCRMYLHSDFAILRKHPERLTWLTIAEFWNEPGWGRNVQYPFRISVNIVKEAGAGQNLHFGIHGQVGEKGKWKSIWEEHNPRFTAPVGEWLTVTYDFIEGNRQTGRFGMTVERGKGEKHVIFDIRNWTHHPNDPKPDGLTAWNPLKLYTSSKTIDHVRSNGGVLQISWDDFELFTNITR